MRFRMMTISLCPLSVSVARAVLGELRLVRGFSRLQAIARFVQRLLVALVDFGLLPGVVGGLLGGGVGVGLVDIGLLLGGRRILLELFVGGFLVALRLFLLRLLVFLP